MVFLDKGFKHEQCLRNGCHYLMQKPMSFNDIPILSVKGSDCRIRFWCMSKCDAIRIMKNSDLNEKSRLL